MSDQIKGIPIGTWITILLLVLSVGVNYGVLQSNLRVIETQIENFKKVSEKESNKQEIILRNIGEQQRLIDANANEIRHLRELRALEKK
ncbi:hypothetical protein V9L05_08700 [Bernardetia sp. Wsw4-3y2]|uniref:hypothetical protein n=1 Tax=Bernardetia sp. Wsw4-3y2 TaxID=3127471 RepID=UPI0030CB78C4